MADNKDNIFSGLDGILGNANLNDLLNNVDMSQFNSLLSNIDLKNLDLSQISSLFSNLNLGRTNDENYEGDGAIKPNLPLFNLNNMNTSGLINIEELQEQLEGITEKFQNILKMNKNE